VTANKNEKRSKNITIYNHLKARGKINNFRRITHKTIPNTNSYILPSLMVGICGTFSVNAFAAANIKSDTQYPGQQSDIKYTDNGQIEIPEKLLSNIQFEFEKRMTMTGHGALWNAEGKRITIDKEESYKLQLQLIEAIESEKIIQDNDNIKVLFELNNVLKNIDEKLSKNELKPEEIFSLQHLKLRGMAYRLPQSRRDFYLWRGEYLFNNFPDIPDLKKWFDFEWIDKIIRDLIERLSNRSYIKQCRDAGVPIPPDFNVRGSGWSYQGDLSQKLIISGQNAAVWTWADPHIRGSCVALPRGSGGGSNLAGIICQNASNGNACFWDNKRKGSGAIIPWASQTLRLTDMQDGTDLAGNCTNCHSGNNVFLVSPDDPTWCRLMRGGKTDECSAMNGANKHNFTLQVDDGVNRLWDLSSGKWHSRYTPLSGFPARTEWKNETRAGCGGACHLNGEISFSLQMQPNCGSNCN
jgi:hypothetical protein